MNVDSVCTRRNVGTASTGTLAGVVSAMRERHFGALVRIRGTGPAGWGKAIDRAACRGAGRAGEDER